MSALTRSRTTILAYIKAGKNVFYFARLQSFGSLFFQIKPSRSSLDLLSRYEGLVQGRRSGAFAALNLADVVDLEVKC